MRQVKMETQPISCMKCKKMCFLRGEITAVNNLTKGFSSVQSNFKHWRARERIIGPEVNRRKRLVCTRKETIQIIRIENKAKISKTKLIFLKYKIGESLD